MKLSEWNRLANRRLRLIVKAAESLPALRRLCPVTRDRAQGWAIEVEVVSAARMVALNSKFRGKPHATDVLSFPAPKIFREQGLLGELVVCAPVLKKQALERGHSEKLELDVLLVHGLLHLLGMDHELGDIEAKEMALWECKLLLGVGLIGRSLRSKPGI